MFRVDAGGSGSYCDGLSRRSFVQLGLSGMAALSLPDVLRARAASGSAARGKDTSVLLIWLDGGPSHMDLYDLKPDAPAEYRGIWRPIRTNVPGMEISELFPRQAQVADKFSIIRSLHHNSGDHFTGGHWMLTGRGGASGADTAAKHPSFASIATRVCGPRRAGMPAYVSVPYASSIGLRPGYFGASYVGREYNPFVTNGDPNRDNFQVQNLNLSAGLTIDRLEDRRSLANQFDQARRIVDTSGTMDAMDRFQQQAYQLVTGSTARKAFDIASEPDETRDLYGRHSWGQSVLLARRLVEAGSTVVTVHFGGWDHHWNLKTGMESHLPRVDQAVSGLLTDLDRRGSLERVLVMICGEFSRTPRMNNGGNGGAPMSKGTPGRDHWGNAMFCIMAGGGLRGGQVVGSTDRLGEVPHARPLSPGDLHATLFHVLGVNPHTTFADRSGRPTAAIEQGQVIEELV